MKKELKILVFGNILVKKDSLALRLIPKLQKLFPNFEFIESDVWFYSVNEENIKDYNKWALEKLDRDYNKKIFFLSPCKIKSMRSTNGQFKIKIQ